MNNIPTNYYLKWLAQKLALTFLLSGFCFSSMAYDKKRATAYQLWTQLNQSSLLLDDTPSFSPYTLNGGNIPNGKHGEQNIVTFGGEKEGSSSRLTKVMGPSSSLLLELVTDYLSDNEREIFLKEFLSGWFKGRYRRRVVKDIDGNNLAFSLVPWKNKNFLVMNDEELLTEFTRWLEETKDTPFSFLTAPVRRRLFNGNFPGLNYRFVNELKSRLGHWTVNLGDPQKYIEGAHRHHGGSEGGWEINFKKLDSYGEWERMIRWFKVYLGDKYKLFQGPGHMWMVFPFLDIVEKNERELYLQKALELFKNIQAYIVLSGVRGKTGMETSKYKDIIHDEAMSDLDTVRGVIRLERPEYVPGYFGQCHFSKECRFGKNILAAELRAGTKDPQIQQFVQKVLISRLLSGDFGRITEAKKWELCPSEITDDGAYSRRVEQIANDYDLPLKTIEDFFYSVKNLRGMGNRKLKLDFIVPLWNWKNAPFLYFKRNYIHLLTRDFIQYFASNKNNLTLDDFREAQKNWIIAANISRDIEDYLVPEQKKSDYDHLKQKSPLYYPIGDNASFDVNQVYMGIEYSTRFPHTFRGIYTDKLDNGKRYWLGTTLGYTIEERKSMIRDMAMRLSKSLGNPSYVPVVPLHSDNAHGHGLSIAYNFVDPNGGKWRVEWDGIGRSYHPETGEVIQNSGRAGHMEIVTPKFHPTYPEIKAVFNAFREQNALPNRRAGGGHLNVDLSPFMENPRNFARFLTVFHKYRSIMSMLYQEIGRVRTSEPVLLTESFAQYLAKFSGSTEELQTALYNNRYFNTRIGRKPRYIQMDISAYYQDVIPEQFVTAEFDILNPKVVWRPQFKADPKIRKIEFRMMDAPTNPMDSALQIKLVRGLLNRAFNDTDTLTPRIQNKTHEFYVRNPKIAYNDLMEMTKELGLDYSEYVGRLSEALVKAQTIIGRSYYVSLDDKLKSYPRLPQIWEKAVTPRGPSEGLNSEERSWMLSDGSTRTKIYPVALAYHQRNILRAREADRQRREFEKEDHSITFARRDQQESVLDLLNQRWKSFVESHQDYPKEFLDFMEQVYEYVNNYNSLLKNTWKRSLILDQFENVLLEMEKNYFSYKNEYDLVYGDEDERPYLPDSVAHKVQILYSYLKDFHDHMPEAQISPYSMEHVYHRAIDVLQGQYNITAPIRFVPNPLKKAVLKELVGPSLKTQESEQSDEEEWISLDDDSFEDPMSSEWSYESDDAFEIYSDRSSSSES